MSDVKHIEDYDLWLRLGRIGKIYNISECSVKFMMHTQSVSAKNKKLQFKNSIRLIESYKKSYPRYASSFIVIKLRSFLYPLFEMIPDSFKYVLFKIYKEF